MSRCQTHQERGFTRWNIADTMPNNCAIEPESIDRFARDPFQLMLSHGGMSLVIDPGDEMVILAIPHNTSKIQDSPRLTAKRWKRCFQFRPVR